MIINAC